jgi:hypothetical protein
MVAKCAPNLNSQMKEDRDKHPKDTVPNTGRDHISGIMNWEAPHVILICIELAENGASADTAGKMVLVHLNKVPLCRE